MKDISALTLAKFKNAFKDELKNAPDDRLYTPSDIAIVVRDSIALRAHAQNLEEDELIAELKIVDETLAPLKKEIDKCKEEANLSAVRSAFVYVSVIIGQFAMF